MFLKRLLLGLYLNYKGIRFYKTDTVPRSPEFQRAIFKTVGGHAVEFAFYRETFEDLIYRRGTFSKATFIGYVIQAKFEDGMPDSLLRYNNLKFFFNSRNIFLTDEHAIAATLLRIYLDFIKQEIKILNL